MYYIILIILQSRVIIKNAATSSRIYYVEIITNTGGPGRRICQAQRTVGLQTEHTLQLAHHAPIATGGAFASILGTEPHFIESVVMEVKLVMQCERIRPKFVFESCKAFLLQHLPSTPLSTHVVLPAIVTRNLLLCPSLRIVCIGKRQVKSESHPTGGVLDLAHFPTMECLYIVRGCRLLVIRQSRHESLGGWRNSRLFGGIAPTGGNLPKMVTECI